MYFIVAILFVILFLVGFGKIGVVGNKEESTYNSLKNTSSASNHIVSTFLPVYGYDSNDSIEKDLNNDIGSKHAPTDNVESVDADFDRDVITEVPLKFDANDIFKAEYTEEEKKFLSDVVKEIKYMPTKYKEEAKIVAQMLYGETGTDMNLYEMSLPCWCVFNRLGNDEFVGDSLEALIKADRQFIGYKKSNPIDETNLFVAEVAVYLWHLEQDSGISIGRTLPRQYTYFEGDGLHNYFKDKNGKKFKLGSTLNPYDYVIR